MTLETGKSYSRQQLEAEIGRGLVDREFRGISPTSEDHQQANFFAWIDAHVAQFPQLALVYAIPNGANKSKTQRYVMSMTGLRSGVPDVHCPIFSRASQIIEGRPIIVEYVGLWIEFKRPSQKTNGKRSSAGTVSPNQKEWIARLRDYNHRVEVCFSYQAAANILIDYLKLPIDKLTVPE